VQSFLVGSTLWHVERLLNARNNLQQRNMHTSQRSNVPHPDVPPFQHPNVQRPNVSTRAPRQVFVGQDPPRLWDSYGSALAVVAGLLVLLLAVLFGGVSTMIYDLRGSIVF
jgi:hypothetical protein